jgi:hypothetical protein
MKGLTTTHLAQASQIFLAWAYPGGPSSIPPAKSAFVRLLDEPPLESRLVPPLCEVLRRADGSLRGYALRLGSSIYPHLKLQVTSQDGGETWVFAVETHDAFHFDNHHPDAIGWSRLQVANRELKEKIERAWEAAGLLTFNGLLRRELNKK